MALHSLSKRSNLAGVRVGFYAGDSELVNYLKEVRKHVGMLVPGPAQAAAAVALGDDQHVVVQRDRYKHRLERLANVLAKWSGYNIEMPAGGFYLWFDSVIRLDNSNTNIIRSPTTIKISWANKRPAFARELFGECPTILRVA